MSPELAFLLTLGLRMAITAAFVVTASIVTERSGPVIGALIATLPISAGPSYVFLALDHDAAFIAEGALGTVFGDRLPTKQRKKLYKEHDRVADDFPDDWPVSAER